MKKREQLENLQVLIADTYTQAIQEMKVGASEYNAALLNGARQLLKDNDVVSLSEQGSPLGKLAEVLPFNDSDEDKEAIRQAKWATYHPNFGTSVTSYSSFGNTWVFPIQRLFNTTSLTSSKAVQNVPSSWRFEASVNRGFVVHM